MKLDMLKEKMLESNKSILALSKESGVAYATVYDIINNKAKNPRINTMTKIATALGLSLEDICYQEDLNEESDFKSKKTNKR